jgi:hypothetical protein
MANNFTVTLDTTAPAGVTITLAAGAAATAVRPITATIATSDGDTTGYQMKIWGSVDPAANANIQATEGGSAWIAFSTSQAVTLSTGDGSKTVNVKVRDDVWNESTQGSDSITLDTSIPVVNITSGPDTTKVSKVSGKRTVNVSWQSDSVFEEYKVKVVPSTGSIESAGTTIPTTNGSTNVAGSAGGYPATTNINTVIDGRDLELASSGDGDKIVKIFVREASGNWSV